MHRYFPFSMHSYFPKSQHICFLVSIVGVALFLEPYIRGWVNYYGKFRLSAMNPIFQLLRKRVAWWARKRYKRYKTNLNKAYDWLKRVKEQFPTLFYQWRFGFS